MEEYVRSKLINDKDSSKVFDVKKLLIERFEEGVISTQDTAYNKIRSRITGIRGIVIREDGTIDIIARFTRRYKNKSPPNVKAQILRDKIRNRA